MSNLFVEGVKTGRNTMTCSCVDNNATLYYQDLDSGFSGLNTAVSDIDIAAIKAAFGDVITLTVSITATQSPYIGFFVGIGATKETILSGSNYFVPMQNVLFSRFNIDSDLIITDIDLSNYSSGYLYLTNIIGKDASELAPNNNTWHNNVTGEITSESEISHSASSYNIHYDANGGTGSMADQIALVDEFIYLTLNAFTKAGYIFAGWALSASGPIAYQDGAEVVNLAAADATVTLYAVWEKPNLKCKLQYNKSENNKAVKDIEDLREFEFKLKDPTSIIDPVLIVSGDITDMLQANYMTIPVFGRSYFITNITSVRTGLVEITAHVDVLSSYIEYLKECDAIIHRQENKWNLYLDDGIFKTYQNPRIGVTAFPSGFTTQNFVLAVAGD